MPAANPTLRVTAIAKSQLCNNGINAEGGGWCVRLGRDVCYGAALNTAGRNCMCGQRWPSTPYIHRSAPLIAPV